MCVATSQQATYLSPTKDDDHTKVTQDIHVTKQQSTSGSLVDGPRRPGMVARALADAA
jgi:hypothetical protein